MNVFHVSMECIRTSEAGVGVRSFMGNALAQAVAGWG